MTKMSLMTEMSHIMIKDQKLTKSEQWPKCHIFWSKVKKLQIWTMIRMTPILIKGQKVTKSEQLPKCRKVWSKIKKLQNLNNYQNVAISDQRSKSYKIWTMTKTLFPLDFVISYISYKKYSSLFWIGVIHYHKCLKKIDFPMSQSYSNCSGNVYLLSLDTPVG